MRPIDADDLVRFLSMMDAYSSLGMIRIKSIIDVINRSPTVYDIDKIVEQLEEERELAYVDFDRYVEEVDPCFDSECDDFFHKGLGRAIKVLKEERKE
jgi:hypothetical protein